MLWLPAAYLLLVVGISGCTKSGLFQKAGPLKKIVMQLPTFNEIVLNDKVNVILTYDSVEEVSVEAGENLLNDVGLVVSDNKLTINDNTTFKWSRDLNYTINVYIRSKSIKRISYYGAGMVTTANTWKGSSFIFDSWTGIGSVDLNLDCDYTEMIIRMGNADITLHGKSPNTNIYCADNGSMNLRNFESEEMSLVYRSIRNSEIYVTKLLTAKIQYKGNVYYKGRPEIKSSFESTGQLIALP
jgi:putative autotransporter adhesin-like protein